MTKSQIISGTFFIITYSSMLFKGYNVFKECRTIENNLKD